MKANVGNIQGRKRKLKEPFVTFVTMCVNARKVEGAVQMLNGWLTWLWLDILFFLISRRARGNS